MSLRSYRTIGHARRFAATLAARHPGRTFTVVLSPFTSYAFCWLIRCGSAYVGK